MTQEQADSLKRELLMENHPDHALNSDQIQKRTLVSREILEEHALFTNMKRELESYNPQKVIEKPVFVAIRQEQAPFDLGEKLRAFALKAIQDPSVIVSALHEANSVLNTISAVLNANKPKKRKPKDSEPD